MSYACILSKKSVILSVGVEVCQDCALLLSSAGITLDTWEEAWGMITITLLWSVEVIWPHNIQIKFDLI